MKTGTGRCAASAPTILPAPTTRATATSSNSGCSNESIEANVDMLYISTCSSICFLTHRRYCFGSHIDDTGSRAFVEFHQAVQTAPNHNFMLTPPKAMEFERAPTEQRQDGEGPGGYADQFSKQEKPCFG